MTAPAFAFALPFPAVRAGRRWACSRWFSPAWPPRPCAPPRTRSEGNEYTEKMSQFFDRSLKKAKGYVGLGKPPAPPLSATPSGCPEITVLDGTGAQRVMVANASGQCGAASTSSPSPTLRANARSRATQMVVKVGVEGRVLLGPGRRGRDVRRSRPRGDRRSAQREAIPQQALQGVGLGPDGSDRRPIIRW